MRCSIASTVVLCCLLRWQLASAPATATAAAGHQRKRLQGTQVSAADAAAEHTTGLARQLRELEAGGTDEPPIRRQSSGARRRVVASTKPAKPHSGHQHPSPEPSAGPQSATTHLKLEQKRHSSPPHVHSPMPADSWTARRLTASDDAAPPTNASFVITKRACGVAVDSDAVKQEVQQTLAPAIGELALQGRVAPVYINVYFSINRVGGA